MPAPSLPASNSPKKDLRQELAEILVDRIEQGTAPWLKPWEAGEVLTPINAVTGKPYRGVNQENLLMFSPDLSDPRWCTYKQARERGWQVRKGAHGLPIEKWSEYEHKRTPEEIAAIREQSGSGADVADTEKRFGVRYYTVFHASQIDGIPPLERAPRDYELEGKPDPRLDALAESLGVPVRRGGDRAFYRPGDDFVQMPLVEDFHTAVGHDTTFLHELSHATGHEHRLNRTFGKEFGDVQYALEELRAEMSAAMTAASLGIGFDPASQDREEGREMGNSAAYLASWLKALPEKERKQVLMGAIKDAQGISDYLIERTPELQVERRIDRVAEPALAVGDFVVTRERRFGADWDARSIVTRIDDEVRLRDIIRADGDWQVMAADRTLSREAFDQSLANRIAGVVPQDIAGGNLQTAASRGRFLEAVRDRGGDLIYGEPRLERIPEEVRGFLGNQQAGITQDLMRNSEEREFFAGKMQELQGIIRSMPETYGTDGLPDSERPVSLRYFGPSGAQWFIIEKDRGDPENEGPGFPSQTQAFGLADLGFGPEMGYISIPEITRAGAELDYHFSPRTLLEVKREYYPELVREGPTVSRGDYVRYQDETGTEREGVVLDDARPGEATRLRRIYRWANGRPAMDGADHISPTVLPNHLMEHIPGAVQPGQNLDAIDSLTDAYKRTMGTDGARGNAEHAVLMAVEAARGHQDLLPNAPDRAVARGARDIPAFALKSMVRPRMNITVFADPSGDKLTGEVDLDDGDVRASGVLNFVATSTDAGQPAFIAIQTIGDHKTEVVLRKVMGDDGVPFFSGNLFSATGEDTPSLRTAMKMIPNDAMAEVLASEMSPDPTLGLIIDHLRLDLRRGLDVDLVNFLAERSRIRQGEHPDFADLGDPVANAEAFVERQGRTDPQLSSQWVNALRKSPEAYGRALGISMGTVDAITSRLEESARRMERPQVGDLVRFEPHEPGVNASPFSGRVIAALDTSGGDIRYHLRAETGQDQGIEVRVYGRGGTFRSVDPDKAVGFDRAMKAPETPEKNAYERKIEARQERYRALAQKSREQAKSRIEQAKRMADVIPFGQPILVGHHSEGRDRRYRARISQNFEKGFDLLKKADYYERRAKGINDYAISADDPDALRKLKERVDTLKSAQERMKAANAAIRKHQKDGPDAQREALERLGFRSDQAKSLLTPDVMGTVGFASYSLSNNNANIRRLEERIQSLEKATNLEDRETRFSWGVVRENKDANRIQFRFDGKPDEEIRKLMKSNGFRWAPSESAWQRQWTGNAVHSARFVIEKLSAMHGPDVSAPGPGLPPAQDPHEQGIQEYRTFYAEMPKRADKLMAEIRERSGRLAPADFRGFSDMMRDFGKGVDDTFGIIREGENRGISAPEARLALMLGSEEISDLPAVKDSHLTVAEVGERFRDLEGEVRETFKARLKEHGKALLESGALREPREIALATYWKHGIEVTQDNPMIGKVVGAIQGKDLQTMLRMIGHNSQNPASEEVFARIAGMNLGKTQSERVRQLEAWAGPERVQALRREQDRAREAASAKREMDGFRQSYENLKNLSIRVTEEGEARVMNGQEYVARKVAKGLDRVRSGKEGAVVVRRLHNPVSEEFSSVKDKRFNEFCKQVQIIADGDVRAALRRLGVEVAGPATAQSPRTEESPEIEKPTLYRVPARKSSDRDRGIGL
ncbi:DUF3560 domain-containing protein [Acidithiobacillus sulfuriphilus]|uniref:DUF3560 domain-containing protein n=1 Tax=Acidithiobacillus sulfuriphilus TaxID=1867749 RepID=UPI003F5E9561